MKKYYFLGENFESISEVRKFVIDNLEEYINEDFGVFEVLGEQFNAYDVLKNCSDEIFYKNKLEKYINEIIFDNLIIDEIA